jgi:hypothetical protein
MDQMVLYIRYIQDQLELAKMFAKFSSRNAKRQEILMRGELQRIDSERAKSGRLMVMH